MAASILGGDYKFQGVAIKASERWSLNSGGKYIVGDNAVSCTEYTHIVDFELLRVKTDPQEIGDHVRFLTISTDLTLDNPPREIPEPEPLDRVPEDRGIERPLYPAER